MCTVRSYNEISTLLTKDLNHWRASPSKTTSRMRVLILVHGYPPTHTAGAEQRAARSAMSLCQRGCEVRVLCIETLAKDQPQLAWNDTVQDGIRVRRLYLPHNTSETPFEETYDNPHTATALEALLQEWMPDVVYLFSGYMMSASVVRVAKSYGIPVTIALTDYWWLCHRINLLRTNGARCAGPEPVACARCLAETSRRYSLPARATPRGANLFWSVAESTPRLAEPLGITEQTQRATFLMDTLREADALISPSHYLARVYIEHGVDPARVHVWRQGVAVNQCLLRTPSPELRVGYLGQMKSHKGVHLLLDAWQQVYSTRPRRLTLYGSNAGEDRYGQFLRKRIAAMENVQWSGHYVGAEVWNVLAQLDLIVVPSRWVENSPNSILEAQAVGVPVIGSNLGGIAELVQHNVNGLLFEPDNSTDLAIQLQRVLDEPNLVDHLRHADTQFSTDEVQNDHIFALFKQLTGKYV